MTELLKNLVASAVTTLTVVALQIFIQALVIAYLYSDLILPPAEFASDKMYDAFTQAYLWLREPLALPQRLDAFIGQGVVSKLFIVPDLVAMNATVAPVFALGAGLLVTLSRALRGRPLTHRLLPMLALLLATEALVHLALWLGGIHVGRGGSLGLLIRNGLRDFVYGGTLLATGVLALTTAVSVGLLRNMRGEPGRIVAAATTGVLLLTLYSLGPARVDARFGAETVPGLPGRGGLVEDYNIILISIDSLRADHLSAYGYERDTAPTLRTLAAAGVRFDNASSTTSWTLPAHMSMLTGRSILGHGVITDDRALGDDVATLAEVLRAQGYATKAITSAPYVESRFGFDHGFDDYDDRTVRFETNEDSYKSITAPLVQDAAARWLEDNRDGKFFLFLHYWDVHYDYAPGPPYDTMFDPDYEGTVDGTNFYFNPQVHKGMSERDLQHILALYDGEIRLVDDYIAKLIGTVGLLGLADTTIFLVTADHGDEFFEHGHKGHHRTLYDEVLRVPMILYVPGLQPTQRVIRMETSIIDIMPTLLSIVGVEIPRGVEGVDMSSVAYRGDPEWDRSTQGELYRHGSLNIQVSLQNARRKIIQEFCRLRLHSFNLALDPGEQSPRATRTGFATALASELTGWLNGAWLTYRSHLDAGLKPVELDEATRDRLEALGYLGD